jgi:hypothetical protein
MFGIANLKIKLLIFWTLSIALFLFLFKNNVSEIGLSPSSGESLLIWAQSNVKIIVRVKVLSLCLLHAGFVIGLFFGLEDGGNMFF